MVKIKGIELKNSPADMTLGEYESLAAIMNAPVFDPKNPEAEYDYETDIEKWIEVFLYAGLTEEALDEMDERELSEAYLLFRQILPDFEVVQEIEVNGRLYRSCIKPDGKMSPRKWARMKAYATRNPKRVIGEVMAVIFEDVELSETEHKEKAHIKHKAEQFRKHVNAAVAVPYVAFVVKRMVDAAATIKTALETEANENSEQLERSNG